MIIAAIMFALMVIIYLFSFNYRREEIKKLNKNKHKLKVLYSMSMFIVTKILKNKVLRGSKVNQALRELEIKENISEEKYLYIVKKVAISLAAIFCTSIFVVLIGISENINVKDGPRVLARDTFDKTYEIIARDESGMERELQINVARKKYKDAEIYRIFERRKRELIKIMLGENKSLAHIDRPVHLINSIGTEKINVSWSISDNSIIGYDGKLSGNVSNKGAPIQLTATFTLDHVSKEFPFNANVFPSKKKTLQESIQEKVDSEDIYSNSVVLPTKLDGSTISYNYPTEETATGMMIIGIIVSITLYFIKDSDLKKKQKKRQDQLRGDYPEIVSMTLLYYEAGLSIKSAFIKITESYRSAKEKDKKILRYAYEELEMCVNKMNSGVSENVAISEYGNRCGIHSYIKFAALIEQNLKRGTRELSTVLREEVKTAMLEKKSNMLKNGGQISTKLMGPMVLMLIISIAIIMVPAFMSMGI